MGTIVLKQATLSYISMPATAGYYDEDYDEVVLPWEGTSLLEFELDSLVAEVNKEGLLAWHSPATTNGYRFFTLLPSGSKIGWDRNNTWGSFLKKLEVIHNKYKYMTNLTITIL